MHEKRLNVEIKDGELPEGGCIDLAGRVRGRDVYYHGTEWN
jgi:hypothetical protein